MDFLKKGHNIIIYPEGTRGSGFELNRGKVGVAKLALWSGAPVIPVGVWGTHEIMPKGVHKPVVKKIVKVKFGKPMTFEEFMGRADDMLIIRGINIYPSQIERVLLEVEGIEPHYMIVIDREGELDTLEVWVEVSEGVFSDDTRKMRRFEEHLEAHLRSRLNVRAKVSLREPRTFERSTGKAQRVLDRRENV